MNTLLRIGIQKHITISDSNQVWTVLDGELNDQWIVPGVHHVNRVFYLISLKPHNHLNIEFRIRHRATSLTKLGLQRQMKVLQKAIDQVNRPLQAY